MRRRRRLHRLTTTFFVVVSLLFSQLTLASYLCPQVKDAVAMAEAMASGAPCEGMDMEQPALCAAHSSSAPQSFETAKVPTPGLPTVVQILEIPPRLDAVTALAVPNAATPEAQPPPDPLFLSTLRLRV